jgi:hypothetical protein
MSSQNGWRWCHKCQGFFFSGNSSQGVCPAGTSHDASQSGHYAALLGDGIPGAQSGWRWCKKCQGFFFSLNASKGVCPADHAAHDDSASGHYSLQFGGAVPGTQGLWRWCHKCQGLFFSGHPSVCPASGSHDGSASGQYGTLSEADPCEPLRQEFLALEKKIQDIQSSPDYIQGPHDPHPGKPDPGSLAEVKALWPEVTPRLLNGRKRTRLRQSLVRILTGHNSPPLPREQFFCGRFGYNLFLIYGNSPRFPNGRNRTHYYRGDLHFPRWISWRGHRNTRSEGNDLASSLRIGSGVGGTPSIPDPARLTADESRATFLQECCHTLSSVMGRDDTRKGSLLDRQSVVD